MSLTLHKNNDLDLGDLGISGYPFTMMTWLRLPDVEELMHVLRLINSSTGSFHRIFWNGHSTDKIGLQTDIGGGAFATATIPVTSDVWHHVIAEFAAANERTIYLDGGHSDTDTTTKTFDGLDQAEAGNTRSTTGVDLAEVAILDTTLDAGEIASLAAGISILALPAARHLLAYQSCLRRLDWPAWSNADAASATGSLEVTDQPPLWYPQPGESQRMPHVVAGAFHASTQQINTQPPAAAEAMLTGRTTAEILIPGAITSEEQ